MAFSDIKVEDHSEVRGPRIKGLLDRLPTPDAEVLLSLFRDSGVPVAKLHRIIQDQADSYPAIDPGWFNPSQETVRKFAVIQRKTPVNGL